MAYSRRCTICATNWPYMSAYQTCPICDEDTWFQSDGVDPLTQLEAQQIIAAHEPEIRKRSESEVQMDLAFDAYFCREHGFVDPSVYLANRSHGAPLDELLS